MPKRTRAVCILGIMLVVAAKGMVEAFTVPRICQLSTTVSSTITVFQSPTAEDASLINGEKTETAIFGMGCFWNPQEQFSRVEGVVSAASGYAAVMLRESDDTSDSRQPPPSYLSVCNGDGRTEAVLVQYVPSRVSYPQLLETFWQNHDASATVEKPQYQSVIWPVNDEQRKMALQDLERATRAYQEQGMNPPKTIVATTTTSPNFVRAESIHQNFWTKLRFKLACLACVTLFTTTQTQLMDHLVTIVATKLILVWVVGEVRGNNSPTETHEFRRPCVLYC